jgi:hypothetical protein
MVRGAATPQLMLICVAGYIDSCCGEAPHCCWVPGKLEQMVACPLYAR